MAGRQTGSLAAAFRFLCGDGVIVCPLHSGLEKAPHRYCVMVLKLELIEDALDKTGTDCRCGHVLAQGYEKPP